MPAPAAVRDDLLQRAKARAELERRHREGGVRYFRPINERQEAALRFTAPGALILGGNRSGKTYLGGAEAAWRLLGEHPYKQVHRAPIRLWACSQDLPGKVKAKGDEDQETHKQLEMLKLMIPQDAFRGGSWARAYSPSEYTISLRNGSLVEFKAYSQGPLQFESDAIHDAWFDEEPPDKRIYTSTLMRLVDYDGQWFMTATPVLSLEGQGWIEELWDGRVEAEERGDYETFQLFTSENGALSEEAVRRTLANLTDEERQVRAFGAFARLGGRVLSEFDPSIHLCDDFVPPVSWRHSCLIDPGWRRGAVLFPAADPDGDCWLYGELYESELTPEQHFALVAAYREQYCREAGGEIDYDILMDPAGFAIKRTTTGKELPSDADEWREAASKAKAGWFNVRPADNGDPMAWRVKRFLKHRRLHVCRSLTSWRWEQERWTRQKERTGILAAEKAAPERPIDRNNHLMDLTRYYLNTRPEPIPREPEPLLWTPERRVEQWREKLMRRAGGRR